MLLVCILFTLGCWDDADSKRPVSNGLAAAPRRLLAMLGNIYDSTRLELDAARRVYFTLQSEHHAQMASTVAIGVYTGRSNAVVDYDASHDATRLSGAVSTRHKEL